MHWIKYVLCFTVGLFFLGLARLFAGHPLDYKLSEEKLAIVTGLSINSHGTKFNLCYMDNDSEVRVRTVTYRNPKKFSPGDQVIIRVAEYESGVKLAIISDDTLIPIGEQSNDNARKFLLCIGGVLVLLAVGLFILDFIKCL